MRLESNILDSMKGNHTDLSKAMTVQMEFRMAILQKPRLPEELSATLLLTLAQAQILMNHSGYSANLVDRITR